MNHSRNWTSITMKIYLKLHQKLWHPHAIYSNSPGGVATFGGILGCNNFWWNFRYIFMVILVHFLLWFTKLFYCKFGLFILWRAIARRYAIEGEGRWRQTLYYIVVRAEYAVLSWWRAVVEGTAEACIQWSTCSWWSSCWLKFCCWHQLQPIKQVHLMN